MVYMTCEGIKHEFTTPRTLQQNGAAEKFYCTMLADSKLPHGFWAQAFSTCVYLLLDGHRTHYKLDTISKAMEQKVIILTLTPLISPLDAGVFGPLKHYWSQECHEWMAKNLQKLMGKVHFNCVQ